MIKIVICDEDNSALQAAEQLLEQLGTGYELYAFTSWAGCLDFMRHQRADLLLCEMRFKDMTGPQLAAALRRESKNKDFALVFVSSLNCLAAETYAVRACDYLLKPLDEHKLLRALQKCKIKL